MTIHDPAGPVDPDVGHIGRGGAVDDLLAGVVDVGQAGPVAPQPDQVGPLAGLQRPDQAVQAEDPGPLEGGHGQDVAGRYRPWVEPGHLLEQGGRLDRLQHVLAVVGGGPVGADADRNAGVAQDRHRAHPEPRIMLATGLWTTVTPARARSAISAWPTQTQWAAS